MTTSVNTMIEQLTGLLNTKDLTTWENHFVRDIYERTLNGKLVATLSANQVETIEKIYSKHFV